MRKSKSFILLFLSIIFSLLSFTFLTLGLIEFQKRTNLQISLDYLASGILCLILSFILAYQHKRYLQFRLTSKYLSITVIKCMNKDCNFKEEREFKKGDYVFKEVGLCPKCNNKLVIASIYARPLKTR